MKRFWTMSLRTRLMIIGLAGVGIALIMGGLAFFAALTYSVNRTLDNEALASAEEVAAMVNENRLPSPIPVSGAQVVQVVDAEQRVIGSSVTADRLTPLLGPNELATALAGEAVVVDGVRVGASEPLRVRAIHAGSAVSPVSVIIGLPFGDVLATRTALRNALLDHVSAAARRPGGNRVAGDRLDTATGGAAPRRGRADQSNGPDPRLGQGRTAPRTARCRRDPRSRRHSQWDARSVG